MIKCTWGSRSKWDEEKCENVAIEKWTEIVFIDPYCGPFDGSVIPKIDHLCALHSKTNRDIILEECGGEEEKLEKLLKEMFVIEVIETNLEGR